MPYTTPISKAALDAMEEIKKLEANILFHYNERRAAEKAITDHSKFVADFTELAEKHQARLKESEGLMLQWIESLRGLIQPAQPVFPELDPSQIELGRNV